MFTQKPIVKRSSWHYKYWAWTFRNWLWKKRVPGQRSLCAYWQRILWIGSATVLLHAIFFLFRLVFYSILYKGFVEPFTKSELVGAFAVAAIFGGLVYWTQAYLILGFLMSLVLTIVLALAIIVLICFGLAAWLGDFFRNSVGPAIGAASEFFFTKILYYVFLIPVWGFTGHFLWQVFRRYYFPSSYRLDNRQYVYNHKTPQVLVHLFFWVLIASIGFIAYKGGGKLVDLPAIPSDGIVWIVFGFVVGWIFLVLPVSLYNERVEQRAYDRFVEELHWRDYAGGYRGKQTREEKSSPFWDAFWEGVQSFLLFLKASKAKICPLIQFVD